MLRGPEGPVSGRASHKRRIALLCILALARGRSVRRERLIGLLWPEHTTETARHSLSESLYVLRKEVGEGISASGDEVRLAPEVVASDVAEFEAALERGDLERAAGVYGGPLLEGFYVSDAPDFERWVDGERDRLARAYARALEQLAETAESEGSALRAVDWWRALAVHDPFNSRVALRLVRALDAAGERATALRHATTHAALLREELGVDRDPELDAVLERLRTEPVRTPAPPPPPRFTVGVAAATARAEPSSTAVDHPASVDATDSADAAAPVEDTRSVDETSVDSAGLIDPPASADPTPAIESEDAGRATAPVHSAVPIDPTTPIDPAALADGAVPGDRGGSRRGDDAERSAADGSTAAGDPAADAGALDEQGASGRDGANGDRAAKGRPLADADRSTSDRPLPAASTPPPRPSAPGRRSRGVLARIAGAVGVAAGLLLAAATDAGRSEPAQAAGAVDARFDPRRIAVLYFDDHSPNGELGYLASGLTESLIHELSQVEALEVISRNGVKPYRDRAVPFDSLVGALRVGSVVEGSLQQADDSIYVTVQLIDAATQAHLESRVVVRPMGGVVALQRAVAEEVAAALRRRMGAEVRLREARAETQSAEALALLLRAEQVRDDAASIAQERDPRDAAASTALLLRADSLLALAEEADPGWHRPVLLRGWVALRLAERAAGGGDRLAAGAEARADRVLARDPRDAAALELRGTARFRRVVQGTAKGDEALAAAERDLRAAVAAEPGRASAWRRLSQLLRFHGSFAESDLAARRALAEDAYLDGADDILHGLYASALAVGDHAAAREWCDHGHTRFPGDWRLLECRLTLMRDDPSERADPAGAWALVAQLERLDPAERARAAGRPYSPVYRQVVAASISARAGDAERARAVLARARREVEGNRDLRLSLDFDEAYVRLLLGEPAEARRLLDELVAARPALRDYVARDPLFRPLFTPSAPAGVP